MGLWRIVGEIALALRTHVHRSRTRRAEGWKRSFGFGEWQSELRQYSGRCADRPSYNSGTATWQENDSMLIHSRLSTSDDNWIYGNIEQ